MISPPRTRIFAPRSTWIGVYDALSARIAERAGSRALWLSSYCVSSTSRACPDASIISSTEMLYVARNVATAIDIPVVVDCDSGYGDPLIFEAVVKDYITSSRVAALCIEDKAFPKRNSFYDSKLQLLQGGEEFCALIRAARSAREALGSPLAIIARTETLVLGGTVDETLARLETYARAGADALLVQTKGALANLVEVGTQWKLRRPDVPLVCVPTVFEDEAATVFWDGGYDVVVYANQMMRASMKASEDVLQRLIGESTSTVPMASIEEINSYAGWRAQTLVPEL